MIDIDIIYLVKRLIKTNKLLKSETRIICGEEVEITSSEKDIIGGAARELSLLLHQKTGKMLHDCDSAAKAGEILFNEED
jgi:hypothetical protein